MLRVESQRALHRGMGPSTKGQLPTECNLVTRLAEISCLFKLRLNELSRISHIASRREGLLLEISFPEAPLERRPYSHQTLTNPGWVDFYNTYTFTFCAVSSVVSLSGVRW